MGGGLDQNITYLRTGHRNSDSADNLCQWLREIGIENDRAGGIYSWLDKINYSAAKFVSRAWLCVRARNSRIRQVNI